MPAEPRLMKALPNGGMICVDVASLQIGLSRCRSFAEDAVVRIDRDGCAAVDTRLAFEEIIEVAIETLHSLELYESSVDNEVNSVAALHMRDQE